MSPAAPGSSRLAGRRRQAAHNDTVILAAACDVFLADPRAPVSAVAAAAGVGISALYRRYPGKEDLLRTLCHDGLLTYIAEAAAADVVADDLTFLLEGAAAIRLPDPARTAEVRRRYVTLFLDALSSPEPSGLPGPPPAPGELNWRWRTRPG